MVIGPRRKEICNEWAAQTMFVRAKPIRLKISLTFFFLFPKKAKGVQQSQNFKICHQKSQIGNPFTQELKMRIMYARNLSIFCYV